MLPHLKKKKRIIAMTVMLLKTLLLVSYVL